MSPMIKAVRVKLEVNSRRDERFILLTSPLRGRDEVFVVCETSKKRKQFHVCFVRIACAIFPQYSICYWLSLVCAEKFTRFFQRAPRTHSAIISAARIEVTICLQRNIYSWKDCEVERVFP